MSVNPKYDKALRTLARLYGVEPNYRDGTGMVRVVPDQTLRAILQAMHVPVSTYKEIQRAVKDARSRRWTKLLDEVIVLWAGESPWNWKLSLPVGEVPLRKLEIVWEFLDETGRSESFHMSGSFLKVVASRDLQGVRYAQVELPFPDVISLGYYQLHVVVEGLLDKLDGHALVIVAPRQCYVPEQPSRSWGVTVQLYGLRTDRNWGIGDFRDLSTLTTWAGTRVGASTIGVNPLHALTPLSVSPYSPSSRLFNNPLYLDVEAIEEFHATSSFEWQCDGESLQDRLKALRNHPTVDYEGVSTVKMTILEELYQKFCREHVMVATDRSRTFDHFVQEQGAALQRFAIFQVLQEHFAPATWRQWPAEFQHPTSPAVEQFSREHSDRLRFFQYLQWQCVVQLDRLQQMARQAGLSYGLYHDLAVGIHPCGADAWIFQDQLACGVSIGAPPDLFNLSGQNWELQPPLPQALREAGYQFVRETFRHNMEYGGMLRIDHALGLFRLYWVPEGCSSQDGAYVRYPTDELLAILALESVRHEVMVIGEDLGTVTVSMRRRLGEAGLLSYRLLMFEKPQGKGFRSPKQFPAQALASVSTHDLPTLHGFWIGRDIETKEQVGLYPSKSQAHEDRVIRAQDRQALLKALEKEQLLPKGTSRLAEDLPQFSEALCRATYAYLARTPCRVLATSLEDLLGELDTPNLPGASEKTYPVWQRKLSRSLEEWQNDRALMDFAAAVHRERPPSSVEIPAKPHIEIKASLKKSWF